MKKLKKVQLEIEKEVISNLTNDYLSDLKGGNEDPYKTRICTIEQTNCNCPVIKYSDGCSPLKPVTVAHTCASNVGCIIIDSTDCVVQISDGKYSCLCIVKG